MLSFQKDPLVIAVQKGREKGREPPTQPCPVCGRRIGAIAGTKEAICRNGGFKDPCCE